MTITKEISEMNFKMTKFIVAGAVTTMLGSSLAQAAFANHDKVTTITTRNYSPMAVETPVIIESRPAMTTTTVQRTVEAPVVIAQPQSVVVERQVLGSPMVERRVEIMNNAVPSTTSTTVTKTTTVEH